MKCERSWSDQDYSIVEISFWNLELIIWNIANNMGFKLRFNTKSIKYAEQDDIYNLT